MLLFFSVYVCMELIIQAATECFLPEIMVRKNLHKFLLKEFDDLYPRSYGIIAHPFPAQGDDVPGGDNTIQSGSGRIFTELDSLRLNRKSKSKSSISSGSGSGEEISASVACIGSQDRVVVAIGPEGGWEEDEVRQFEAKGFKRTQLGSRILRTDIAVCFFPQPNFLNYFPLSTLQCNVRLPLP